MIARAQWWYYTRKHALSQIPFETYRQNRTRETESQPMKSSTGSFDSLPPLPSVAQSHMAIEEMRAAGPGDMTFNDVVRLIAQGRAGEVPTEEVPDGINEAAPSVSTMGARKKPWEVVPGGGDDAAPGYEQHHGGGATGGVAPASASASASGVAPPPAPGPGEHPPSY